VRQTAVPRINGRFRDFVSPTSPAAPSLAASERQEGQAVDLAGEAPAAVSIRDFRPNLHTLTACQSVSGGTGADMSDISRGDGCAGTEHTAV
jgi:hypothetical protein